MSIALRVCLSVRKHTALEKRKRVVFFVVYKGLRPKCDSEKGQTVCSSNPQEFSTHGKSTLVLTNCTQARTYTLDPLKAWNYCGWMIKLLLLPLRHPLLQLIYPVARRVLLRRCNAIHKKHCLSPEFSNKEADTDFFILNNLLDGC